MGKGFPSKHSEVIITIIVVALVVLTTHHIFLEFKEVRYGEVGELQDFCEHYVLLVIVLKVWSCHEGFKPYGHHIHLA